MKLLVVLGMAALWQMLQKEIAGRETMQPRVPAELLNTF